MQSSRVGDWSKDKPRRSPRSSFDGAGGNSLCSSRPHPNFLDRSQNHGLTPSSTAARPRNEHVSLRADSSRLLVVLRGRRTSLASPSEDASALRTISAYATLAAQQPRINRAPARTRANARSLLPPGPLPFPFLSPPPYQRPAPSSSPPPSPPSSPLPAATTRTHTPTRAPSPTRTQTRRPRSSSSATFRQSSRRAISSYCLGSGRTRGVGSRSSGSTTLAAGSSLPMRA